MNTSLTLLALPLIITGLNAATIGLPADPFPTNGDTKDGLVRATGNTGSSPLRWSYDDPTFAKPFDPDGDNKWGTAGYVMFANNGVQADQTTTVGQSVSETLNNAVVIPSFVGAINYANTGGFTRMNTTANYNVRTIVGATGVDSANLIHAGAHILASLPENIGDYVYGDALTITITEDTHFIMGVQMDFLAAFDVNVGERALLTDGSTFAISRGYGATATGNIADTAPDMVFFDVNAQAGDTLTLKIGNVGNTQTYYHGITFDVVPPVAIGSLGYVTLVPGSGTATAKFTLQTTEDLANPFTTVDSADIVSVSENAGVLEVEFNTGAAPQVFLRVDGTN